MIKHLLITILFLFSLIAYAEKAPIKFGKVDIEDLKMTVYEPDTSASAVVLCKYGYFNANDLAFKQIIRVKILKKAGTELSEFTFPGSEDMLVRGRVYNLVDGEIEEDKLKNESVFKVKVTEDYYNVRVALPNVKVGSVYDIETTEDFLPDEFSFQREIPVKYCELLLEDTQYINYRKRMVGYENINNVGRNKYIAENMPAFKAEPYIDCEDNYISKFEFDLLNISVPGFYREYSTSWQSVNKRLRNNAYFGGVITRNSGFLKDIAEEIEAKYVSPYDKMVAAYEAIKQVKWNGEERLYAQEEGLNGVFKDKKANSAEINMMLYQLLKKLEIQCAPVVLSTRSNGALNQFYPTLYKLNYLVIKAQGGDKDFLLDATDELLPAGMLPKRCLNHSGRLVNNDNGSWVPLAASEPEKITYVYNINLFDDLHAEGKMNCRYDGYAAYEFRKDFKEYSTEDEFLQDFESKNPGIRVKKFVASNLDSIYKPVELDYELKIVNYTQQIGDLVMIDPLKFNKIQSNPFLLEDRKCPVDFGFKKERTVMVNIALPEHFSLNSLPKPSRIVLPEKKGAVLINYSYIGSNICVTYRFSLNEAIYTAQEYAYLKQLYALIIEKQSENIVIKREVLDEASL